MVQWRETDSSAIKRIGRYEDDDLFVVETEAGNAYMYEVPPEMLQEFLAYSSVGKGYNKVIRGNAVRVAKGYIEIEDGKPIFKASG